MTKDINQHVASCSTCTQAKAPRYFPVGKLKLIPMAALLPALEVTEALFQQIFCYYGVPEDIISDSPVHLTGLVCVYGKVGGLGQSHIWVSPSTEWPS